MTRLRTPQQGFTLIEVMLATLLLVGGIAAATFVFARGMYAGSTVDTEMNTQALGLAEEKMEQIRGTAFGSIATEAKAAVSGWSGFSRDVAVSQPSGTNSDFKQVVVTVYWNSNEGELSSSLTSYVANASNG